MLSCRGGGKLSRPVYLDPHPPEYQSKIILLYLVTGVGDKLSRLVYLAPHPSGYQSKSIVPILLILNYLNVKMYQSKT